MYQFGAFTLDTTEHRLTRGGDVVHLTPKVFETLVLFLDAPGRLLTTADLMARLWPGTYVEGATLARNISDLRRALGETPENKYIETIAKKGYRFVAPVQRTTCEEPPATTCCAQPASVAVLPFNNATSDPQLGDAIAEELIHLLAQVPQLRVAAGTSSFRFRARDYDPQTVARDLHVSSFIEGRLEQTGDLLRMTIQIIDSSTGHVLLSERQDADIQGVVRALPAIVASFSHKLTGVYATAVRRPPTSSLKAWRLYWEGRHLQYRFTREALAASERCFRSALAEDPEYAPALAGLAETYNIAANLAFDRPVNLLRKAEVAIADALERDSRLAEAHAASGVQIVMLEYDWKRAEIAFRRAIAVAPSSSVAHHVFGFWWMRPLGRISDALVENEHALRLDPLSAFLRAIQAYLLHINGDQESALDFCAEALRIDDDDHVAYQVLGRIRMLQGNMAEALEAFQRSTELSFNAFSARGTLGMACAVAGHSERAHELLRELEESRKREYVPATSSALIHLGLGDSDACFRWLQTALNDRDPGLLSITSDPAFSRLRQHRGYTELLSAMGLSDAYGHVV
jgi:DNA-binding winged helix-turn-helix (wHTH) protein/Tfp pilus assembly protein PilF